MFIVYARYVNKRQPMQTYLGPTERGSTGLPSFFLFFFFAQNIFIFYACKVMFVLKETLESLISFSHALHEPVQMGWINSALQSAHTTPPQNGGRARERKSLNRRSATRHNAVSDSNTFESSSAAAQNTVSVLPLRLKSAVNVYSAVRWTQWMQGCWRPEILCCWNRKLLDFLRISSTHSLRQALILPLITETYSTVPKASAKTV